MILFLRTHQRQVCLMPLEGMPDGTQQPIGVDVALDEIILRPAMHRFHGDGFIICRAQHDHRHKRRGILKKSDVCETCAIWEKKFQQDDAEVFMLDAGQSLSQRRHCHHASDHFTRLIQHPADGAGKRIIMFDEQNLQRLPSGNKIGITSKHNLSPARWWARRK